MPYPERERRFPISPEANELKQDLIRRTWLPTRLEVFPQGTHPSTSPSSLPFWFLTWASEGPAAPGGTYLPQRGQEKGGEQRPPHGPGRPRPEMLRCRDAARPAHKALLCLPEEGPTPPPPRLPTLRSSSQTLLSLSQIPFNTLFTFRRLFSYLPSRWPGARSSRDGEGQTKGDFCLKELLFFPLREQPWAKWWC